MARKTDQDDFRFEGFESPNTTPVPDVVFDRLLARLGEAELKSLLYIIRRTFGFKRDRDPISFNQFLHGITTRDGRVLDEGCGVRSRTTLSTALKSLEEKGIVVSEKGVDEQGENVTTVYRLRFRSGDTGPGESPLGVVRNSHHPGTNFAPRVVLNSYPQQTGLQQTENDHSNIRMALVKKESDPTKKSVSTGGNGTLSSREAGGGDGLPDAHVVRTGAVRRLRSTPLHVVAHQTEAYQIIQACVSDFARELNDTASLKASTTRAYNLYRRAGVSQDDFVTQLYAARAIVKERVASIRSHGSDVASGFPRKQQAGYYFAVLEDLLGLRDERG